MNNKNFKKIDLAKDLSSKKGFPLNYSRKLIDDLLKTQVETNMSTDNLAMALRGDYKQQGDWGETQLKVILEKCGLREGYEYELQEEFKDDNNDRKRPDAIVKLPNDVVVPIDSK